MVSKSLRNWFVIHFILDFLFAVPLLLIPVPFIGLFGWTAIDPMTARLVGAALMGIGVESYLGRNAGVEAYMGMLNLKIIWSASATFGITITMLSADVPPIGWSLAAIFGLFCILWSYYRIQLGK